MVLKIIRSGAVLIAGMVIAGCSNFSGMTSVSPSQPGVSDLGQYRSAARDGVVRTVIIGNPLSVDKDLFAQRINQILAEVHTSTPAEFRTMAEPDDSGNPRIVIVFSPPVDVGPSQVCSDDERPPDQMDDVDTGRMRAVAAFCVGTSSRIWTRLQGPLPASLEDPLFIEYIQRIGFDVIPPLRLKNPQGDCRGPDCT